MWGSKYVDKIDIALMNIQKIKKMNKTMLKLRSMLLSKITSQY